MKQIKKTENVLMIGDTDGVTIDMLKSGERMFISIKTAFQVKRGLESYIQRFYRLKK